MTSDGGNMGGKTSGSSMQTGTRTAERAKVAVAKQSMLRASLHAQICQGPRPSWLEESEERLGSGGGRRAHTKSRTRSFADEIRSLPAVLESLPSHSL